MVNQHSEITFIFSEMRTLRVSETKLTFINAFISDLFALEGEKESKYNERTLFWGSLQKPDLSVNPQSPRDAYTHFSGPFQFQTFFGVLLLFLDIKSKFTGLCTKFYVKQAKFLPPLVCCNAASQYSEITFAFSKILKRSVVSKC